MQVVIKNITDKEKRVMLRWAWKSIYSGLDDYNPASIPLSEMEGNLELPGATFVTILKNKELRGCIGSLEASRPLLEDAANNAFAAAFKDSRFRSVEEKEMDDLDLKISILMPSEKINASTEEELMSELNPGLDGLILRDGRHRATFLPSVWDQLPDREEFLAALKRKAGLMPFHWSNTIQFWRYRTVEFSQDDL